MNVHSQHRPALRSLLPLLLLLLVSQLVLWPSGIVTHWLPQQIPHYSQWHLLLEIFSIVISFLVFGLYWGLHDRQRSQHLMMLSASCLGVGLLDLMHAMSYVDMPDLITPGSTEKAINFWLAGRLFSVAGLLLFAFGSTRPLRWPVSRWLFLGAALGSVGLMVWIGLWHPDWLPRTHVAGQGLTSFKVGMEALFITLHLVAALGLYRRMAQPQTYDLAHLFAASCVLALSELFFATYTSATDALNMLGHIYKIIAYVLIYRSIFISAIRTPYQQLQQSRSELDQANRLLHNVIETIPLRVYWQDAQARYQGCNSAFARDVGASTAQQVIGKRAGDLPRRAWAELCQTTDRAAMASAAPQLQQDLQFQTPGQEPQWLRSSSMPLHGPENQLIGLLGIYEDITERKQVEEFQQLTAAVYEHSNEAIMVTDAHNQVIAVNPAFSHITGYQAEEVIGQSSALMEAGLNGRKFYAAMIASLNTSGRWHGEMWYQPKQGATKAIFINISTICDASGRPQRYVAIFADITQRKQSEALIWRQANFDALTELPNRNMLYDRLEQEMRKSQRSNLPLALLLLDLDLFKEVNDTLGHDMGDQLLKEAAVRIRSCVRDTDTVARLGGDEFSVVLGELEELSSVERIAQNILDRLAEPFQLGDETSYISASIGITLFPDDAADIDALIKNADQAMYAAKHAGRGRYRYFTSALQDVAQKRMRLANDLRLALPAGQFLLHYQPIVELHSGAIHKAEALLRWQHPERGMISPAEFIPIAEDTGLIVAIGDWVFHSATRQLAQWRQDFCSDFQLSVNKSPVQFRQENSSHAWVEHLHNQGLSGDSIVVEITEGLLMDAGSAITGHLLDFCAAGINVALDDFGTGYSSLAYLKKFDIDYLKIDQSFVRNLAHEAHDLALCEAIIVMAHKLNIKVIAEGVETLEQRDLLAQMGCDYAQGYFYSRPLPPAEFTRLLASSRLPQ